MKLVYVSAIFSALVMSASAKKGAPPRSAFLQKFKLINDALTNIFASEKEANELIISAKNKQYDLFRAAEQGLEAMDLKPLYMEPNPDVYRPQKIQLRVTSG